MRHEICRQDIHNYLLKDNKSVPLDHCIEDASLSEAKANLREIEKFRKIFCNPDSSMIRQVATDAIEEAKDGIARGSEVGTSVGMGVGYVGGWFRTNFVIMDMADRGQLKGMDLFEITLGGLLGWAAICATSTIGGKILGATTGGALGLISGGTQGLFSRCCLKKLDDEQIQMVLRLEDKARQVLQKLETNSDKKIVPGMALNKK